MPDKRKPASPSSSPPYTKRPRPSAHPDEAMTSTSSTPSATPYERPRNHPIYGQKSAFPGLDDAGDDELFYGPAEDGLEYLRMVRSEANSLPFLFTAPPKQEKGNVAATASVTTTVNIEDGVDDNNDDGLQDPVEEETTLHEKSEETYPEGTYYDGVYFAAPARSTPHPVASSPTPPLTPAQSNYYNLLHHRFLLLRSILKCTPPSPAISSLDDSHPITLPRHSKNARREWRRLLFAVDPQTVQLACMDLESVLGVMGVMARLMSENVRSGDAERVRRIGAWSWGLLAKCREVGELGTEEVAEIRDLGKRAAKILGKMGEEEEEKEREEEQEDEEDEDDAKEDDAKEDDEEHEEVEEKKMEEGEEDLEEAKARLQAKLERIEEPEDAGEVGMQTRAMLDMILTVVGEYFGQKDLLGAREVWK